MLRLAFAVLALVCFLWAKSYNGKGPNAALKGLILFVVGVAFAGSAILLEMGHYFLYHNR